MCIWSIGLVNSNWEKWGSGIGRGAVCMLLDYIMNIKINWVNGSTLQWRECLHTPVDVLQCKVLHCIWQYIFLTLDWENVCNIWLSKQLHSKIKPMLHLRTYTVLNYSKQGLNWVNTACGLSKEILWSYRMSIAILQKSRYHWYLVTWR